MFFYNEPDNEGAQIQAIEDPYFYNTSLLLNMDSNFSDSSVYQNSTTTGGGVSISTVDFKYGDGSGYFNGNGDAITIASSDSLDLSGQDWTIETWIRPNGDYSNWRMILTKRNSSGDYNYQLYLDRYTGELRFYPGGAPSDVVTGVTPQANVWSHVAVARSNGTVTVYLNGNSVGSMVSDTDFNSAPLGIGCVANGVSGFGGHGFFGYIDDVRITKGVARYTTNFTPPTEPHPTTGPSEIVSTDLQLHLDAGDPASYPGTGTTWYDLSGNGYNGTFVGTTSFDSSTNSMYFDSGPNTYIQTQYDSLVPNISLSVWFKAPVQDNDPNSGLRPILLLGDFSLGDAARTGNGPLEISIARQGLSTVGTMRFEIGRDADPYRYTTSQRYDDDQWHNVVLVKNNNQMTVYIDGVLIADQVGDDNNIYDTSLPLAIGGGTSPTSRRLLGRISEVLVYEKTLTAAEVLQNFNATKDRFGL